MPVYSPHAWNPRPGGPLTQVPALQVPGMYFPSLLEAWRAGWQGSEHLLPGAVWPSLSSQQKSSVVLPTPAWPWEEAFHFRPIVIVRLCFQPQSASLSFSVSLSPKSACTLTELCPPALLFPPHRTHFCSPDLILPST